MSNKTEVLIYPATTDDLKALPLLSSIQFAEPFAANALNRMFEGVVRVGIYRGFEHKITGEDTIDIGDDTGKNTATASKNGYTLTVQGQKAISVTVPRDVEHTAVIEVNFDHGLITKQVDKKSTINAAEIKLIPTAEVKAHHTQLFKVLLPSGSALTNEDIDTSVRVNTSITGSPTYAEADSRYDQSSERATSEDIENESKDFKNVKLPQLWTFRDKLLKFFAEVSIKANGAIKFTGNLRDGLTLSIDDATAEQKGVTSLSNSTAGESKQKAATEYALGKLRQFFVESFAPKRHGHDQYADKSKDNVFEGKVVIKGEFEAEGGVAGLEAATQEKRGIVYILKDMDDDRPDAVITKEALESVLSELSESTHTHDVSEIEGNIPSEQLPVATTSKYGITKLTNSLSSEEEGEAASALALANAANIAKSRVKRNGGDRLTGNYYVDGNLSASGDIGGLSDRRVKKNFRQIKNASSKVEALNGFLYERTDIFGLKQIGLIAQEVQAVMPEAVSVGTSEDDLMHIKYNAVIALLVEAHKESAGEIKALKRAVVSLGGEL